MPMPAVPNVFGISVYRRLFCDCDDRRVGITADDGHQHGRIDYSDVSCSDAFWVKRLTTRYEAGNLLRSQVFLETYGLFANRRHA